MTVGELIEKLEKLPKDLKVRDLGAVEVEECEAKIWLHDDGSEEKFVCII